MLSLCAQSTAVYSGACSPSFNPNHDHRRRRVPSQVRLRHRRSNVHVFSIDQSGYFQANAKVQYDSSQNLRTLFPGGYKRPEIKVPSLVLKLSADEILKDKAALDKVDEAVAKTVGVVLLDGGDSSGGKLYEAACLLKSVIRDRAYLVISERVDIAAAIGASGVVLSDQGLPTVVARKTMLDSRSGSVVLPLVARTVQTSSDALRASSAEGADFLIYSMDAQNQADELAKSVLNSVKVPIFVNGASFGVDILHSEGANLLKEGASGFVVSLCELGFFSGGVLDSLFLSSYPSNKGELPEISGKLKLLNVENGLPMTKGVAGFSRLEEKEKLLLEQEKLILLEAIDIIHRAAPLMGEASLLIDAVSQLDEPFLLVIVGEFNSGKSTVINALLGNKYLEDGVVPTTNEIMFLNYTESESTDQRQRCERHPDGQLICYLPALILKDMNIVDTPGTNVILQRQQRLTEEFVPRADLLLFIMSADRPLTESEVEFLHYTQKWKKKAVFVLNKSDLYQNANELDEAVSFIKENVRKLLNTEHVILYPVSARSALEAKLLASSYDHGDGQQLSANPDWRISSFSDLEMFLYSFLDGSTDMGIERMKLKLETPIGIAERLLCACQKLVDQQIEDAKQDLDSIYELIDGVKDYTRKVENESLSWKKQASSLITSTQERVLNLIQSTLQISNLNLITTYVFRDTSSPMPVTSRFQDDIVAPAISDAQKLLGEYVEWLESKNYLEKKLYKETLEKRWPSFVDPHGRAHIEAGGLQLVGDYELSISVISKFSDAVLSKLFEQEIREVFLETFGGVGAAGLSASLLTSVLPTTLEDLLALALCSAGGLISISNFPIRRQKMVDKVKKSVNSLILELEDAMQKDLVESSKSVEEFVKVIAKPYQEVAQNRLDKFLETQGKLTDIENKIKALLIHIQNLHIS